MFTDLEPAGDFLKFAESAKNALFPIQILAFLEMALLLQSTLPVQSLALCYKTREGTVNFLLKYKFLFDYLQTRFLTSFV